MCGGFGCTWFVGGLSVDVGRLEVMVTTGEGVSVGKLGRCTLNWFSVT